MAIISGIHCNISRFIIPKGVTVLISRYDGSVGGMLDVTAQVSLPYILLLPHREKFKTNDMFPKVRSLE